MGFKISIQKIYSKGSGKFNEDGLLIKNNTFAVFDGVTSLVEFVDKEGKTGGKLATTITKQVFSRNNKSLKELAILANNRIWDYMKSEGVNTHQKEVLWSTIAAVIRLKEDEAEFFQIGDCLVLIIYKDGSYRLLTEYKDHDLETVMLWKELSDKKAKNIRDKLRLQIIKVRREANITHGCLNGEKEAIGFFVLGKVKLSNIKSLILFTDGLFIPKENPQDPENWNLFVKTYQKAGLKGLLNYVRSIEKDDPNCWKYPRFKKHDDAAAIGIDFL